MFRSLIFIGLLFGAVAEAADLDEINLTDGRSYLIAVPEGVSHPPLILALHGGGGNPAQFARDTKLADRALENGFAIAFPAGSGRTKLLTWNAIYCCAYAYEKGIDDVAFLDRVISDAEVRFGIDAKRIYMTGMSNGSMMAETYAVLRPGRVKAVAGVSGTMDVTSVRILGAVPLLHIHGTADTVVLYDGGYGPDSPVKTDFVAVNDLLAAFLKAAPRGLTLTKSVIDTADDGMSVDRLAWSRDGQDWVVHLRVNGGGHNWPGGFRGVKKGATRDIDASDEVIAFFVNHL